MQRARNHSTYSGLGFGAPAAGYSDPVAVLDRGSAGAVVLTGYAPAVVVVHSGFAEGYSLIVVY